jgi:hypothetical protein
VRLRAQLYQQARVYASDLPSIAAAAGPQTIVLCL